MPLHSNDKIRDTLYNIEQFKFDAQLQPELKMKGPSNQNNSTISSTNSSSSTKSGGSARDQANGNSAMSKKMIKDSDKSSGTNNLVGNGSSSTLTGKNPFAVLKPSSIAA